MGRHRHNDGLMSSPEVAKWMSLAACQGIDPRIFDLDVSPDPSQARSYCYGCEVREPCLVQALHFNEYGVWGATTDDQRKRMRRFLGIQPARHPQPIPHGTTAGARAHYRRGDKPCRSCADAQRVSEHGKPWGRAS